MYIIGAGLVGMLVTLMATFNSQLAVNAGQLLSLLIFHLCGFACISLIIMVMQQKSVKKEAPLHLYFGGIVGVLVVYLNNLCFIQLGASITLSMIIMGQSIGSVLTDSTGFLNMEKHAFRKNKLAGLSLMLLGILGMVDQWQLDYIFILLALLTGMLVLLSILLTSQLGLKIGVLKATQINYLAGLITVTALVIIGNFNLSGSLYTLPEIHPAFILGGGICGVLIVIGFNTIVPKIPALYTTILMFIGQILTGLVIDYHMGKTISARLITGCIIVFSGLMINIYIDKRNLLKQERSQSLSL